MEFVESIPVTKLPKRTRGGTFNQTGSDALFAIVSKDGKTASDGKTHETQDSARKAAQAAARLLRKGHADIGERVATRIFGEGAKFDKPPFRYVVFLRPIPAPEPEKETTEAK